MKNLKIFLLIITIPLILTGCFGENENSNGETTNTSDGKQLYQTTEFSMEIPFDWDILEKDDLRPNVPEETIVAFRNNIKSDIFTANVNISRESVEEGVHSSDYSRNSKLSAQKNLISFQEINSQSYILEHEENSIPGTIIEFSGKKSPTDPIIQFKNLYIVHNDSAYTITAAHLPEEDETIVKYTGEMLESFSLK